MKYMIRPCKNCLNDECVWMGSSDNFQLCEDYKVDITKAATPRVVALGRLIEFRNEVMNMNGIAIIQRLDKLIAESEG
mgnify:CR=1 FL=1